MINWSKILSRSINIFGNNHSIHLMIILGWIFSWEKLRTTFSKFFSCIFLRVDQKRICVRFEETVLKVYDQIHWQESVELFSVFHLDLTLVSASCFLLKCWTCWPSTASSPPWDVWHCGSHLQCWWLHSPLL